ncbi:MAG: DUF1640 domain-containing protein [Bacteroidia bacterium]|nr:DUF1640 domain-containing protein [Bacteroidia bacterium]
MAKTIIFDTLAYSKKFIAAGFSDKQAEVQVQALAEILEENLVTKRDLKELEQRLTIRLGIMLVAAIGIFATIIKLI